MNLKVLKISSEDQMQKALVIRHQVFVIGQGVDPAKEYDEYERDATHFLATIEGNAVGTGRWRLTENGVKLERFAVLEEARGKGVGQALVKFVLDDIANNPDANGQLKYLHSQLDAVSLYAKFGFRKSGSMFEECNIQHFKMKLA